MATSPSKPGEMQFESVCYCLHTALALEPSPIVGGALYALGVEGMTAKSLLDISPNNLCAEHKFNMGRVTEELMPVAAGMGANALCICQLAEINKSCRCRVVNGRARAEPASLRCGRGRERQRRLHYVDKERLKRTFWTLEFQPIANAYQWMIRNRDSRCPKGCECVFVYQTRRSESLPPGFYVYKSRPSHFGCTAQRPLAVLEQFNFETSDWVPDTISVEVYPGGDSFSAVHVIDRNFNLRTIPEYSNRLFGEATALDLILDEHRRSAVVCGKHLIVKRTGEVCVIDMHWNAFETWRPC